MSTELPNDLDSLKVWGPHSARAFWPSVRTSLHGLGHDLMQRVKEVQRNPACPGQGLTVVVNRLSPPQSQTGHQMNSPCLWRQPVSGLLTGNDRSDAPHCQRNHPAPAKPHRRALVLVLLVTLSLCFLVNENLSQRRNAMQRIEAGGGGATEVHRKKYGRP